MENRQFYPLSTSQKLIFLAERFTFHKQLMNIPTSCLLSADLDLALLKKSAVEAVRRNDALGLRLVKQGKETVQYFVEPQALGIEIVDFSGKSPEDMEKFFDKTARTRMRLYEKPLCIIYIIRSPDNRCGLFICVSHIIMDSWAISMFYKDIFDIYFALKSQLPLPKPMPRYESVLQKEIAYLTSEKHDKDAAFWEQEISGPKPIFTHVNGSVMLENYRKSKKNPDYRYGRSFYLRTTARHFIRMVDKSDVEKMTAFCRENYPLSLQVLFFMGVRTSIARLNKREKDVSLFAIAARRATLEEKMAGGTRALALPFRTIMEENLEFKDALNQIMDKQNMLYRHADYDTMDIFKLMRTNFGCPPQDTYFPLHFTFQPLPMVVKGDIPASTNWYCNGAAATNLSLAIMDGDGTGSLRCYYEYHDQVIKPETLNSFHDALVRTIMAGVDNPHIQLKDLLDMPV